MQEAWTAVNVVVRKQELLPVVDVAGALAAANDHSALVSSFDSGDGIHPNNAGAKAIACAVHETLNMVAR